jgi:hypothetical protein
LHTDEFDFDPVFEMIKGEAGARGRKDSLQTQVSTRGYLRRMFLTRRRGAGEVRRGKTSRVWQVVL